MGARWRIGPRQRADDQALPREDGAAHAGGDPVVTGVLENEGDEAIDVQRDLLRHRLGAHPDHGEHQVPRRSGSQTVRNLLRQPGRDGLHLSGSEIREIDQGFGRY